MFQVSPVAAQGVALNRANVVVSPYLRTGEAFEDYAESSRRNVKVAGLEPDALRVRRALRTQPNNVRLLSRSPLEIGCRGHSG